MKSYIQYPVTPSFSNIQVSRRYNDEAERSVDAIDFNDDRYCRKSHPKILIWGALVGLKGKSVLGKNLYYIFFTGTNTSTGFTSDSVGSSGP